MFNDYIINILLLFIVLEVYEIQWQKAQTMIGMLARMYQHYQKSVILFLVMHPTFYFAIWFLMVNEDNGYAAALLFIKTIDIALKLMLIKQVFIDKEISRETSLALLAPLHKWMPYIGLGVYLPLIYMVLV